MDILYNKSNQVLVSEYGNDGLEYKLYSYKTLVLKIVKGEIVIDARAKTRKNYDGIQSVTTSKHITQALDFLGIKG